MRQRPTFDRLPLARDTGRPGRWVLGRGHVSDDRMVDLLEEQGTPDEWTHLANCPGCRTRLDDARAAIKLARRTEIPEPPGMYWEALRRNVGRRIAEEPERRSFRGWMLPLAAAAAALLVIAVSLTGKPPAPTRDQANLPAWSALPPLESDEEWLVVAAFAETSEETEWSTLVEDPGLGAFVASLSDEESEALVEALRANDREEEM